jgi:hypothetical protein
VMHRTMRVACAALSLAVIVGLPASVAGSENGLPSGTHDGAIDPIAAHGTCYANGWSIDPDDPDTDVHVRILVDGEVIATVRASEYREDLLAAGISDGTAGFWVDLSTAISPGVSHEIRTQAEDLQTGAWVDLDASPRTLLCTNLFGSHDVSSGSVGRAECSAAGWAFDADAPAGPRVRVRIMVDGRQVATVTADDFRADVRDAGYGDGYSGWSINLFGRITPYRDHVVIAEARDLDGLGTWVALADSAKVIHCRPAA